MSLIERSLTDEAESVSLAIRQNDVLVKTAAATIYSRLVEGRFPRYQDVFPKDLPITIPLSVGRLAGALRQAKIVTSDESRGVDFQ